MADVFDPSSLQIGALVGDPVARIRPDATLLEVADVLHEAEVGALVLGDGDRPEGVVSERDLVRALAERRDPATTTAAEVARGELLWVEPEASVAEVANEMMNNWVRHVLVGADRKLVGIVSVRDLVGAYASAEEDDFA